MANEEDKTVDVSLSSEEVRLVINSLLNCPIEINVKSMPHILALAQGILKKLQPRQEAGDGVS